MRGAMLKASALALTLAATSALADHRPGHGRGGHEARAEASQGRGHGDDDHRGRGRGGDDRGRDDRGRGRGDDHARDDHGRGRGSDGRGRADRDRGDQPDRARDVRDAARRDEAALGDALRDLDRRDDAARRAAPRDLERELDDRDLRVLRAPDGDDLIVLVRERARVIEGCPPGLAWRDNGCLPPGQARRLERAARFDWLWDRPGDDFRHHYVDGYLYRTRDDGGLAGWMPVLAGALGLNNVWPAQYVYEPPPAYYTRYYRLGDRYDYRYADGVIYAVDPETARIQQVAALLTGQPWTVGQAMPAGFDVYNVPYSYRGRYVDTADRWYRYNDGYVYQVDPTTRLVQAVIQLLT